MVRLVDIAGLKPPRRLELNETMETMAKVLREGAVTETIVIGEEGVVKDNLVLYEALRRLGVRYVPVSRDRIEEVYVPLEHLGFYDEVSGDALKVYADTLELLYRNWPTPLVRLRSLSSSDVRVWAKLEAFNPFSGSVKDRIGWSMFMRAMEEGNVRELLYEATSTNTGMALAAMAAIYGVKAKLYLPATIQKASDTLLRVMGAEVIRMPKSLTVEFIEDVDKAAKKDGAMHLNQFENDANFEVHLRYTAKELDAQVRRAGFIPKAIIRRIGTSGHMSAIAFYFKNRFHDKVGIYCVQPAQGSVIPGIRRIETGMKWIHMVKVDRIIDVERDEAIGAAISIARSEGLLIGLSSGAVVAGFRRLLNEGVLGEGDYVLVFPDHGFKYVEQFSDYLARRESG